MNKPEPERLIGKTQSVCPECLAVIDCEVVLGNEKIYHRKRCEHHGLFEELVFADAADYLGAISRERPGSEPARFQGEVKWGCPADCGLCPDHKQHTCVGVIEITTPAIRLQRP